MNELALYQYNAAALTVAPIPRSGNYTICAPDGAPAVLKRGIDFGMIRKKNGDGGQRPTDDRPCDLREERHPRQDRKR